MNSKGRSNRASHLPDSSVAPEIRPAMMEDLPSVEILGVPVHDVTLSEVMSRIPGMISSGRPHHIVTVNPEFVILAQKHDRFRAVLQEASISIPDGVGIVWGSRIVGGAIRERVAGVDLVEAIAGMSSECGYGVFLLGARDGVAERTAEVLKSRHAGLRVSGTYAGSPDPDDVEEIARRIEGSGTQILLVAYGAPKQDLWIRSTMSRLRIPLSIGVGGTFDYIAEVVPRAPKPLRDLGFEWLYRLVRQPWRWKRMVSTLPAFGLRVLWHWVWRRRSPRAG